MLPGEALIKICLSEIVTSIQLDGRRSSQWVSCQALDPCCFRRGSSRVSNGRSGQAEKVDTQVDLQYASKDQAAAAIFPILSSNAFQSSCSHTAFEYNVRVS